MTTWNENYDSHDRYDTWHSERFPPWVSIESQEVWQLFLDFRERFPEQLREDESWRNELPLIDAPEYPLLNNPPVDDRPRVFISHRQNDRARAKRVRNLCVNYGVNYWLDVEDPVLNSVSPHDSLATAALIEVALLNCSHVIALYSDHTQGSSWVPYEYGRVKAPLLCDWKAGIWNVNQPPQNLPEWVHLGRIYNSQNQLDAAIKQIGSR